MHRCPNCRRETRTRELNDFFPFCSARCRAIDLSRWFTGSYRVPGPPAPDVPLAKGDKDDDR